jgi:hypothetical protein
MASNMLLSKARVVQCVPLQMCSSLILNIYLGCLCPKNKWLVMRSGESSLSKNLFLKGAIYIYIYIYGGRTERHEQQFFVK